MSDNDSSRSSSEHNGWDLVDKLGEDAVKPGHNHVEGAEDGLHETCREGKAGQSHSSEENLASREESLASPHPGDSPTELQTPPATSSRKRIVVTPRRSLSLTQAPRPAKRLLAAEADAAEGDWHATKHYEEDIRRASAMFPKPRAPAHTHRHLKLLLVGESCVGKTTLIKNLFAAYCRDSNPDIQDAPRTIQDFIASPEESCTDVEVQVQPEDSDTTISFHYCIQDTPAVNLAGADDAILYYIEAQSHQYLTNEDDTTRRSPVSSYADCRIDACLYLVPPHSLKPSDVSLMGSLSKHVPVIPLLSKADAMTTAELDAFRHHVQQELAEAEEVQGHPIMYTFAGGIEDANEEFDFKGFPLATIASRTMDESIGRFWPVRSFPWGKCEAMSSIHSDVSLLKALLFERGYEDLKALTEARYYNYRDNAYASAAAARTGVAGVRASFTTADNLVRQGANGRPKRCFGWLACSPWKVCAAVVVFALALSVDNLLLRREVGRQRGLHSVKDQVIDSLSDSLSLCERRTARFVPANGHLGHHRY